MNFNYLLMKDINCCIVRTNTGAKEFMVLKMPEKGLNIYD